MNPCTICKKYYALLFVKDGKALCAKCAKDDNISIKQINNNFDTKLEEVFDKFNNDGDADRYLRAWIAELYRYRRL